MAVGFETSRRCSYNKNKHLRGEASNKLTRWYYAVI